MSSPVAPIVVIADTLAYAITPSELRQSPDLESLVLHCPTRQTVFDVLYHRGVYATLQTPGQPRVILIDLARTGTDSMRILKAIKRDVNLQSIPVFVLISADHIPDMTTWHQAGITGIMQKPVNLRQFLNSLQRIDRLYAALQAETPD